MVVLGLILLAVAVVAAIVLIYDNSDNQVDIHAFGGVWHASAFWMAVVGAAILLLGLLGLALMRAGGKRAVRRRSERRQLKKENAALAEQVAHSPSDTGYSAPAARFQEAAGRDARSDRGGSDRTVTERTVTERPVVERTPVERPDDRSGSLPPTQGPAAQGSAAQGPVGQGPGREVRGSGTSTSDAGAPRHEPPRGDGSRFEDTRGGGRDVPGASPQFDVPPAPPAPGGGGASPSAPRQSGF